MNKIIPLLFFLSFWFTGFSQSKDKYDFADTVFAYICKKEIKYPQIVMKQAIVETGYFYPNHLMRKNNLFGFRVKSGCLTFNSWQESVDYYKEWQDRKYTNPDEDYYRFLVRIHYASSHYPSKLRKIDFDKTCPENSTQKVEPITVKVEQPIIDQPIEQTPSKTVAQTKPQTAKKSKVVYYTVKKGDTLGAIAQKYKTSVPAIKKNNHLKSNMIKPGQKLKIIRP